MYYAQYMQHQPQAWPMQGMQQGVPTAMQHNRLHGAFPPHPAQYGVAYTPATPSFTHGYHHYSCMTAANGSIRPQHGPGQVFSAAGQPHMLHGAQQPAVGNSRDNHKLHEQVQPWAVAGRPGSVATAVPPPRPPPTPGGAQLPHPPPSAATAGPPRSSSGPATGRTTTPKKLLQTVPVRPLGPRLPGPPPQPVPRPMAVGAPTGVTVLSAPPLPPPLPPPRRHSAPPVVHSRAAMGPGRVRSAPAGGSRPSAAGPSATSSATPSPPSHRHGQAPSDQSWPVSSNASAHVQQLGMQPIPEGPIHSNSSKESSRASQSQQGGQEQQQQQHNERPQQSSHTAASGSAQTASTTAEARKGTGALAKPQAVQTTQQQTASVKGGKLATTTAAVAATPREPDTPESLLSKPSVAPASLASCAASQGGDSKPTSQPELMPVGIACYQVPVAADQHITGSSTHRADHAAARPAHSSSSQSTAAHATSTMSSTSGQANSQQPVTPGAAAAATAALPYVHKQQQLQHHLKQQQLQPQHGSLRATVNAAAGMCHGSAAGKLAGQLGTARSGLDTRQAMLGAAGRPAVHRSASSPAATGQGRQAAPHQQPKQMPLSRKRLVRSIRLLPPPADAAAAKALQSEFQFRLFAHHSKYVLDLLQPAASAKLSCLIRLSASDLTAILQQPQPEQLLDQVWDRHRSMLG